MKEKWDLYNEDRQSLFKTALRGSKLHPSEFHIVVNVWIKNTEEKYLISQRSKNKKFPLKWETTGGSVLAGETSLDAALREVNEELGINLEKNRGKLIGTTKRYYSNANDFLDVWLFEQDFDIKDVIIQEDELNDAMWASKEEIKRLYNENKFEANAFFNDIIC